MHVFSEVQFAERVLVLSVEFVESGNCVHHHTTTPKQDRIRYLLPGRSLGPFWIVLLFLPPPHSQAATLWGLSSYLYIFVSSWVLYIHIIGII